MTREAKKTVYFVTGHGEASIAEADRTGYSIAKQGLEEQNYIVKDLLMVHMGQIPDDVAVVVIAGPRKELLNLHGPPMEQGGHLLLMLNPETIGGSERFCNPMVSNSPTTWSSKQMPSAA